MFFSERQKKLISSTFTHQGFQRALNKGKLQAIEMGMGGLVKIMFLRDVKRDRGHCSTAADEHFSLRWLRAFSFSEIIMGCHS